MTKRDRLARLKQSRSQLLIALRETTESENFTKVITAEYIGLPDQDTQRLLLIVGVATLARTGVSISAARETYEALKQERAFDAAQDALEGVILPSGGKRLTARHELYVRHVIENVAEFPLFVEAVVGLLRTFTKYKVPVVKNVGRLDSALFKFLLNHNFIADIAKRRGEFSRALQIYQEFEIDFQLDGHYWLQYGQFLVEMGDLEEAVGVLNKSIQAYPGNPYAAHAYADVQLRVALRRRVYDSVSIQLIGDAVEALEELDAARNIEFDQYPIITLATNHVGALEGLGQRDLAKDAARGYFNRLEKFSKGIESEQVATVKERLLKFLVGEEWNSLTTKPSRFSKVRRR